MTQRSSRMVTAEEATTLSDGTAVMAGVRYWIVTEGSTSFTCTVEEYDRRFGRVAEKPVAVPASVRFNPVANRWEMVMSDGGIMHRRTCRIPVPGYREKFFPVSY